MALSEDGDGILTEEILLTSTRKQRLEEVVNVNLWGAGLSDVSILHRLLNIEVLSLSVNEISSLSHFSKCSKLRELYLRKNQLRDLAEIRHLRDLAFLHTLRLDDNELSRGIDPAHYRETVIRVLPQLFRLDNFDVSQEERAAASADPCAQVKHILESIENLDNIDIHIDAPQDENKENVSNLKVLSPENVQYVGSTEDIHVNIDSRHVDNYVSSSTVTSSGGLATGKLSVSEGEEDMRTAHEHTGSECEPDIHAHAYEGCSKITTAVLLLLEELDAENLKLVRRKCTERIAVLDPY